MDLFGSGFLFATQATKADGSAVTNPTPVLIGILQELTLDISSDLKELYGQQEDAVDVARAKRKITGKIKHAKITALLWDSVFFGAGLTAGQLGLVGATTPAVIPTTPFTITVTPPNSGTYGTDLGVIGPAGIEFTKVASAPTTGQYSQSGAVYTFAAADVAKNVFINYSYSSAMVGAFKQDIPSQPMGSAPIFGVDYTCSHAGENIYVKMTRCISSKLSIGFKNEDFTIPEIDFQAFYDPATGRAIQLSYTD